MVSAGDVDRLFLQAVLSRGIMSVNLAQALWKACIDAVNASNQALKLKHNNDKNTWNDFVSQINRSIDKLDLEFRTLHDEVTGTEMYAIANRKGDEIAQMASDYTPIEIAFFKAVVEQIMLAPHEAYSVSSIAALRELNAGKINMTKSQAEVVLASFVARGWLLKSPKGRYSLSTRSLLELLPYLKSTYPDELIECTICMEILTRGVACQTPNCKARMHNHCFVKFRRTKGACPACSAPWPREPKDKPLVPIGEDAARAGDDQGRRARQDDAEDSDADADAEAEEDEDAGADADGPSQEAPPKKNRKGKKSARDDSMDVAEEEEDVKPEVEQTQGGTQRLRRSTRH